MTEKILNSLHLISLNVTQNNSGNNYFILQELVKQCTKYAQDHAEYQEAYTEARDWLTSVSDQLIMAADVRGDRHSLEAKLQKILVCLHYTFDCLPYADFSVI